MMQLIVFTKHLRELSLTELVTTLADLGAAGADLAVRPGYPVNPQNMTAELPRAAAQFRDAGLQVPLVTAPTSLTAPESPDAERFYEACGKAGVARLKLGYWNWSPDTHFWDQVAQIREWLQTFQEWSRTYGVRTVVHNHSGRSLGMNSSMVMHLVDGCDPAQVGVFADTGHLAVCGEPIDMALDIVRDRLACIAFKDRLRVAIFDDRGGWAPRGAPTKTLTVPLGRGFADLRGALRTLAAHGFDGPISMHSEYDEPVADVVDMTRIDVRFVKSLLAELDH